MLTQVNLEHGMLKRFVELIKCRYFCFLMSCLNHGHAVRFLNECMFIVRTFVFWLRYIAFNQLLDSVFNIKFIIYTVTCWYNDGLKNSVMTVYSAGLGKCLVSMKKDKVTFTFTFIQMFLPYKYIRTYLRLYRHIESCKHSCSF